MRLNRAILQLLRGNLREGWRDYAARLDVPGKAPICDHNLPRWTGEARKGKRLLVTAEQGVGDQLMFASLIHELGANVILDCELRLVSLFARSFRDVTVKPSSTKETKGGITRGALRLAQAIGRREHRDRNGKLAANPAPRDFRVSRSAFLSGCR